MKSQCLKKLKIPDSPGIYYFRDTRNRPIYIGRATSLQDRIKSYFSNDLIQTRGPKIVDMIVKAHKVTWQEKKSVLEAVIDEGILIRKYKPKYNTDEKDDKSAQYVIVTDEEMPRVFLARARDIDHDPNNQPFKILKKFGPYPESNLIKEALRIIRKLIPFRDKKANDIRYRTFYESIGYSPGTEDNYKKNINRIITIFDGGTNKLKKQLEKEMRDLSLQMKYEEANRIKKLIIALNHINDISLIKREKEANSNRGIRIEAYDISHTSGKEVVGVMTVSIGNELAPSEYRKFKLRSKINNDIACLKEIVRRRLAHSEWTYPDLVVIDGGKNQLQAIKEVILASSLNIPVVSVVKDDKHKARAILGNINDKKKATEIIRINNEAHRFAISYHRNRLGKPFTGKI